MTIIFTIVALIVLILAVAVWWHIFFGVANPPLPRTTVVVQTSSPGVAATMTSVAASSSVSIPAPVPGVDQLSIDGAMFNVEIASTSIEQARGLSYRTSLGENDGMLFLFGGGRVQTFWMKDMNFPLDMIWISGNTVAGFAENVPVPPPGAALWSLPLYTSPDNVDKVLEVNADVVAKYNIKVGDAVNIGPVQ